jgi:hypothetical protein
MTFSELDARISERGRALAAVISAIVDALAEVGDAPHRNAGDTWRYGAPSGRDAQRGLPHSLGHYVDFGSAVLAFALFPVGVVPLSDGAGEVAAIGEGVTRVKIGDRIAGCFHPRWFGGPIKPDYLTDRLGANLDGMLAEYAVFNEEAVVLLPSHLSFEEAATLPCAAVTAWVALTGHRRVTAGDIVLTQGSGGVSVFALQFARPLFGRGRMRSRPLPLPGL